MKQIGSVTKKLIAYGVAMLAITLMADLQAQSMKQGKAEVKALKGTAKYSSGGGVWVPLKVGTVLRPGASIQTGADSYVDLFLDQNGPLVRVTAETTMGIDKLNYDGSGSDSVIDTQLDLQSGRIVGRVKKLASASKYQIKLPNGVAGIRGTDYDVFVRPLGNNKWEIRVTSVTGTLVGSAIIDGREVTGVVHDGQTWRPETGVEPTPEDIIREARRMIAEMVGGVDPDGGTGGTIPRPDDVIHIHISPIQGQ
jgi:hypothetical protein